MRNPVAVVRGLARLGVLGINRRNAEYTLVHNPRKRMPLVDDKLQTKELALRNGVAVPPLYGVIDAYHQLVELPRLLAPHRDFVIKPSRGSQGSGIVVVTARTRGRYRTADGEVLDDEDLAFLASDILAGIHSLGGMPDKALIEYRVNFDPVFEAIAYRGVPDIRIIVYLGVPVMAMVRLPTRQSRGKANLHQGAVGAGVDLATGRTTTATWRGRDIAEHPDTGNPIAGVQIPHWRTLLEIGARSQELTGLGYQGIDLVLDRESGPMLLELNARPGLAIQLANRAGLAPRLEKVDRERAGSLPGVAEKVDFALRHFAAAAPKSG